MIPLSARRRGTAATLAVVALAVSAACSSTGSTSAVAASAVPSAAGTSGNTQAACAAEVAINGTDFPGIDPDAPAPSAQELKDFAARIRPTAQSLRSNVPTQLVSQADVLMSVVDRASQGRAFDPEGSGLLAAGRDIDAWMFDHCGYRKLEVTSNDGIFIGLPASVPAGPVAIRFTSRGSAEKSAFVLLFGQVRAGSTATARDIASGQANLEDVADIRAVAQPTSDQPAYTVRNLPAGSYIVSSPLGTPPNFDGGTAAVAFRVS